MATAMALGMSIDEAPFGGASYESHGSPLTDETLAAARAAKAVLMGAVGGLQYAGVPRDKRPEAGLLGLRAGMGVFANLRPALCFGPLAGASSLKKELVEGLDFMIVRELTGGVYFGKPRGIETLADGSRRGVDTQVYTTFEIERIARVAFELARAAQQGALGRKIERHGDWPALARGGHRPASPRIRRCRADPYSRRQRRHADRPAIPSSSTSWSPTTCSATSCRTPRPN